MIDKYNRVIDYIRISVTDRCNLRCVYCMPETGVDFVPHDNIMTYEEILRLCKCFGDLGIHKVKLTGGEPLVRKNLPFLIKKIKEIPGIDNITLTTNGILLAKQMESLAHAGVDSINVSLDTLDEKQFESLTRFNHLNKVMEGIREALKYKEVSLKINCVPLIQANSEENILSMVSLAKENKVHIRFIEIMPIGLGKNLKGYKEERIREIIKIQYGELTPYKDTLGNGPCHYYSLEGFKGKIGFISALSHQFCDSCNRIRLTSEGILKNCLQYASGEDLKQLLRQGITEEELKVRISEAIWNKPKEHHFNDYKALRSMAVDSTNGQPHFESGITDSKEGTDNLENRKMSQIGG